MTHLEVLLKAYPVGLPTLEDFEIAQAETPELQPGEILVRTEYLSMDPFPRMRMNAASRVGPSMRLGEAVEGRGAGYVVESRSGDLDVGEAVVGEFGWREFSVVNAGDVATVDRALGELDLHLSGLGASGLTAYFLHRSVRGDVGGRTYVIAPAAGSVGAVLGQLAIRDGARAIGVCDGPLQIDFLKRLGFADVIERAAPDLGDEARRACPDGWDVFQDGVGGPLHDAMTPTMNAAARIMVFGFISGYGDTFPKRYGDVGAMLMKRAELKGFLLADFAQDVDAARQDLAKMISEGQLKVVRHVSEGLQNAPAAFISLFQSSPPGKQLVRVHQSGDFS